MALPKTLALVLYSGGLDKDHLRSTQGLPPLGVSLCSVNDHPLIPHARSYLSSFAMQNSDADVFVWLDDDIVFRAEDVVRLAEVCRDGHPLIGAAYAARSPGGMVIGGGAAGETLTFFEGGAVCPVAMLGLGFTAIHRKVFEAVGADMPTVSIGGFDGDAPSKPYFACLIEDGKYYGEDASFCLRAARAGFAPELDTRIRIQHKGAYLYGLEDSARAMPRASTLAIQFGKAPPLSGGRRDDNNTEGTTK